MAQRCPEPVGPARDRARRALVVAGLICSYVALHVAMAGTGESASQWALLAVQLVLVTSVLGAAVLGHSHARRPVAAGRVVAIVPAYEENPAELNRCIRSILDQSGAVVAEVHVVDDGSRVHPVQPWRHPRVVWHRKPNGGKRSAQHLVLDLLAERPETVDFILTVDSDSVLQRDAVAHLLRAFSDPRVTAASGTVYVSNAERTLMTRVADLNIGAAVTVSRIGMSLLGTLTTTSGALAMYRAGIPLKRRDHYLASGTFGDDRRLTLYAELEGRAVIVPDAIVYSAMPTGLKDTYRQQLRWAKSRWTNLGFTLTNMPPRHLVFPIIVLARSVVLPLLPIYVVLAVWGAPDFRALILLAVIVVTWLNWRYAWTALYLLRRTDRPARGRLVAWALLTPVEMLYIAVVLLPLQYLALLKLRDRGWGTRRQPHVAPAGGRCAAPRPTPTA